MNVSGICLLFFLACEHERHVVVALVLGHYLCDPELGLGIPYGKQVLAVAPDL